MPESRSRSSGRGELRWKLTVALCVGAGFAFTVYFRRELSTRGHYSHLADHNLGHALVAGAVAFLICSLLLFRATRLGGSKGRRALEAAFHGAAARLGGTVLPPAWPQPPRIHFPAEGRAARLEFSPNEVREGITRVTVDLRDCSPGTLRIFHDSIGSFIPKLFGAEDLQLGDPAFDQRYIVQASPTSIAKRLFGPERRAELIRSVQRLDRFPGATIHLTRESLTVRCRGYLGREADLLALAGTAVEFTRGILALAPPLPVFFGEVASGGGDCLICGSPLKDRIVRCRRCQTPHHGECWSYNGGCSIFGCGEQRATQSPS